MVKSASQLWTLTLTQHGFKRIINIFFLEQTCNFTSWHTLKKKQTKQKQTLNSNHIKIPWFSLNYEFLFKYPILSLPWSLHVKSPLPADNKWLFPFCLFGKLLLFLHDWTFALLSSSSSCCRNLLPQTRVWTILIITLYPLNKHPLGIDCTAGGLHWGWDHNHKPAVSASWEFEIKLCTSRVNWQVQASPLQW